MSHKKVTSSKLLTVTDVQKIRVDRARVNHDTYKQLYAIVHDRIKRRASVNATHLTYVVPPFVPGRPVYVPGHAARYITDKLRRGGFAVLASEDGGTLLIDWTPRPTRVPKPEPPPPPPPSAAAAAKSPAVSRQAVAARLEALKRLI
jgi:hypothetical protein